MLYFKYPRTYHLPTSKCVTKDDKVIKNYAGLIGYDCVITEKMDGENTTIYRDKVTARSLDSGYHQSRCWVKEFASKFQHELGDLRVCGETLFDKHFIHYTNLESYFLGFGLWEGELCHSWDTTLEFFNLLGIPPVTTIYRGILTFDVIDMVIGHIDTSVSEGFVIRRSDEFMLDEFNSKVAKWVRPDHVVTDKHWSKQEITKNLIIK